MLNRTEQPTLQSIHHVDFVKPQIFDITSNVKLYFMKEVNNETARFDLYFDAGTTRGEKGIPSFVSSLLLSGTQEKSSIQIHNQIDALGGFMESGIAFEASVISMFCLRENILPLLHVLVDGIDKVAFFESEIDELIQDKKQAYLLNLEKVSFLAQKGFQQRLFHTSDTYSRVADLSYYENINSSDLRRFYNDHYLNGLFKIVVVGNLEQDAIDEIIDTVGKWAKPETRTFENSIQNLPGQTHIEKEGAVQTAIRLGKILFNKTHEEYNDFMVLNTILGDYFGSRLMSNIREDKGYTYGIGSMVAEYNQFGYFMIATEVATQYKDATLTEIQNEINRLQTEFVSDEELELVRNYLLGQLLKSADGPYSMMDLYIGAQIHGFEFEFYNKAIKDLYAITPKRIQELAIKYLVWDEMTIVTAG